MYCITILTIIGTCILYHYSRHLPEYGQLKNYYPSSITRIYSADGQLVEEYSKENRIFVPIQTMPKLLIEAFIAAEDKNFYYHSGVDIISIIRAAITNINHIVNKKRIAGGSTITQQVVKNFLLNSERSIERKMKEVILSYMISQVFTKDKILELYLNQIYLGQGAYGVASAALHYFNKSVEELTLNESAVLASLPKAPSTFNPEHNYQRAFQRKNYVLKRMYADNYITQDQLRTAIHLPIQLKKFNKIQTLQAHYYVDKVRDEVISMFGEEYFYTAGLTIFTCIDSKIQQHAVNALRFGIQKYDVKTGYRGPLRNISLINWQDNLTMIPDPCGINNYKLAVILLIENEQITIGLKSGKIHLINLKDINWMDCNLKSIKDSVKIGDVIVVRKLENSYKLEQIPEVNGGIIVLENSTGRVLAAEGGYDYTISKFDRTTQAKRQPGSLIKPFVYLSALENGAKPNDIFEDAPIEIEQGDGMPNWKPKNYENNFLGPITLRQGLEKSRNTLTVRVGQFVGISKVHDTIKRFGISNNLPTVPSIMLGAIDTTLAKMTLAYGMIANNGRKLDLHYIELIKDRKGNVIYQREESEYNECKMYKFDREGNLLPPQIHLPKGLRIVDEATNYQVISLMMGCIERGTGKGAKNIKKIIAGKTGTTNQAKDAWFIGFTPHIIVGTYIGYDYPKTLGEHASGASVALPVFVDFMKNSYHDVPSIDFVIPPSITLQSIDYNTGKFSQEKGSSIIEAFKKSDFYEFNKQKKMKVQQDDYNPFNTMQEDSTEPQE